MYYMINLAENIKDPDSINIANISWICVFY